MIAILDYGFGNVRSAQRAFTRHGVTAEITSEKNVCIEADGLVIPGVGAFAACMDGLVKVNAASIILYKLPFPTASYSQVRSNYTCVLALR